MEMRWIHQKLQITHPTLHETHHPSHSFLHVTNQPTNHPTDPSLLPRPNLINQPLHPDPNTPQPKSPIPFSLQLPPFLFHHQETETEVHCNGIRIFLRLKNNPGFIRKRGLKKLPSCLIPQVGINNNTTDSIQICEMSELVARTGRHHQRYESGCRLIAGCIPFRLRYSEDGDGNKSDKIVEVLMINSTSGPGLLFPKGGWENDETVEEAAAREALEEAGVRGELMHFLGHYYFKSKTLQDEFSPEGRCRAAMFALFVKEELESWPEQSRRVRTWVTISEAVQCCRHSWMREALENGFIKWSNDGMARTMKTTNNKLDACDGDNNTN